MPTLLNMPRELRDLIFELTLLSPPRFDDTVKRKVANDAEDWLLANRVHYLTSDEQYRPTALSLLLVNHQLYEETSSLFARTKLGYKLHMTIVDWCWLWPTWHYIPTRMNPILDFFDIELYFCRTEDYTEAAYRQMIFPDLYLTLFNFIHRLLHLGPIGDTHDMTKPRERIAQATGSQPSSSKHPIAVKTIRLNVKTLGVTDRQPLSREVVPGRTVEGMQHLTNDPLYACDGVLAQEFGEYLEMRLNNSADLNAASRHYGVNLAAKFCQIILSIDKGSARIMNVGKLGGPTETDNL